MQIYVNGESKTLEGEITLSALLEQLDMDGKRIAIELNGEIVPRSAHTTQKIASDDRVEIVHAIGGG